MVLHDLLPTNTRLHRIRLVETEDCTLCGKKDTTIERLADYGVGEEMWKWTRRELAARHRTAWRRLPPGWFLGPNFATLATTTFGDTVDPSEPSILPSA